MRARAASALVAVWVLWPSGTPGQSPIQFRSKSDTVEVHATVKLKNGTIARDLTQDDFELFEDGKAREITVFNKSIQPLSVALVLDHSGSTARNFDDVMSASREFLGHLLKGDRAALSTLSWDCHQFTDKFDLLMVVLRSELPADNGSPIWSATDRAMSSMENEGGRRVILLLSDGEDNQGGPPPSGVVAGGPPRELTSMSLCAYAPPARMRSAGDVVSRAESEAITIYTVIVQPHPPGSMAPQLPVTDSAGAGDLRMIARQTGGSYQALSDYSDLKGAFRSVADELHLQYVLGFAPTFTDGKMHKIEVKVKRSGVTVQARKGYMAEKKAP